LPTVAHSAKVGLLRELRATVGKPLLERAHGRTRVEGPKVPSERTDARESRGTSHTPRSTIPHVFFVYLVRCADATLYTGIARDPEARVRVHNSGKGAKYTRARLPVTLVYSEPCESLSAALKRERQIKPWSRTKKDALIAGWHDGAASRAAP
jgi:putative endonuclease